MLVICNDWLTSMDKLPDKAVTFAMKSFAKDVRALWVHQGEEQQQKRKVDSLAKQLDRRAQAFQKVESRFLEYKPTEEKESESEHGNEYFADKVDQLDRLRRKLDAEKEKHHKCMQETQRTTLNGFQSGFSTIFESLTEFSTASQKMYNDLVVCSENDEKAGNRSYIEDSKAGDNGIR